MTECLRWAGPVPPQIRECRVPCKDDCALTAWSRFTECSGCGGSRSRKRSLTGKDAYSHHKLLSLQPAAVIYCQSFGNICQHWILDLQPPCCPRVVMNCKYSSGASPRYACAAVSSLKLSLSQVVIPYLSVHHKIWITCQGCSPGFMLFVVMNIWLDARGLVVNTPWRLL